MQLQDRTLLTMAFLSINLFTASSTNAALISVLGGQAINDTDLGITWLADANYAMTSGYDADGQMNWTQANNWIASLNAENGGQGHLGYNNWRLPTTTNDPSSTIGPTGYNKATTSELAHLYYTELGNKGKSDSYGYLQPGWGLKNTGPFSNFHALVDDLYWSGTDTLPTQFTPGTVWAFSFYDGFQGISLKDGSYTNYGLSMYAIAVRDGLVATVPVPAAVWLFSSGLIGLIGFARRKSRI